LESLSPFTLGLIVAVCVAFLAYAAATPFCRAPSRKAVLDAMFEAFFGAFLTCMFGYPTIRGFIEDQAWFVTKRGAVVVLRVSSPNFFWSIEGFGSAATMLGALILFTGVRKVRRARNEP